MKIVTNIIRTLCRPAALALTGLALLATTSQAASIDLFVYLHGDDMALVVPGSKTGGRFVYSHYYGGYITDRVQRGEKVWAYLTPTTTAEMKNPVIKRFWRTSDADSKDIGCYSAKLPMCSYDFTIPTNPFCDHNSLHLTTASGTFTMGVPVGTRP